MVSEATLEFISAVGSYMALDVLGESSSVREGRVRRLSIPPHGDHRGSLVALETDGVVPFEIRRIYYIFGTLPHVVRGEHAHRTLSQMLICVKGACTIDTETSTGEQATHVMASPTEALLIEGLVWREMRDFTDDAVLLVLADQRYDEGDYVRDYAIFKRLQATQPA
jgi:dTDP-4-dehydrorhamnose 3,5-epimerase